MVYNMLWLEPLVRVGLCNSVVVLQDILFLFHTENEIDESVFGTLTEGDLQKLFTVGTARRLLNLQTVNSFIIYFYGR